MGLILLMTAIISTAQFADDAVTVAAPHPGPGLTTGPGPGAAAGRTADY